VSAASDPQDDSRATGLYAAAEYSVIVSDWVSPRAYAGALLTRSDQTGCGAVGGCDVSEQIAFAGGKVRFSAPIPYVAPFVELGLGLSTGTLSTRALGIDEHLSGATYHIPVGLGLSLGDRHQVDVGFFYLFHPAVHAFGGAAAVGLTIPMR
jgi:hypothetical protein